LNIEGFQKMDVDKRAEVLAWILDEAKKDLGFREWLLNEIQQIKTSEKMLHTHRV
jgi:hypothetical protein